MFFIPFRLFLQNYRSPILPFGIMSFATPEPDSGDIGTNRPLRILAFGDSLVAGFAVPSKAAFPVRLEKALRHMGLDVELINAGLPGDTTTGGRNRMEKALETEPDMVILEFGANDNLTALDPELTEANLDAMLKRFKERNIAVLLTGIGIFRDLGEDYRKAFTGAFTRLAEKHQVPLYPDFLEGVNGRPELNKADGIHPNPKGIDEIVRRMTPLVVQVLQQRPEALDKR